MPPIEFYAKKKKKQTKTKNTVASRSKDDFIH